MSRLRIFLASLCVFTFFMVPNFALAENVPSGQSQLLGGIMNTGRSSHLSQAAGGSDLQTLTGKIIGTLLSLIGLIFFILTVYGGFMWMTAHGEESQIETGKNTIKAAVIGMVIIFSAYAITRLVLNSADRANSSGNAAGQACTKDADCADQHTCVNNVCEPVFEIPGEENP